MKKKIGTTQLTRSASKTFEDARFRHLGDVVYPLELTNSKRADPSTPFDGVVPVHPSLPPDVHPEASRSTKGDLRGTANKLVSCHLHQRKRQGRRF